MAGGCIFSSSSILSHLGRLGQKIEKEAFKASAATLDGVATWCQRQKLVEVESIAVLGGATVRCLGQNSGNEGALRPSPMQQRWMALRHGMRPKGINADNDGGPCQAVLMHLAVDCADSGVALWCFGLV
ncbi:unnamed protein product [Citrullus colocynthis]|uniref:Uncharacterized protein n=1 Tax=Citrullus colocynthis TaxID=252529 RepID=A0ABP0YLQ0_9ROSI